MSTLIGLAERGYLPDSVIRLGIRRLLEARLRQEESKRERGDLSQLVDALRASPIAIHPDKANEQHYEVPPAFFEQVLGRHKKYSCCDWSNGHQSLDEAERAMLALSVERAEVSDGMDLLELGCGWGALTLYLAENFPNSRVLAVSNSTLQREFIVETARRRQLSNVEIVTADMNDFRPRERFDRVLSLEMFEHMRNYQELMRRIASWLTPEGKLFVHIFCHREYTYPFETEGDDNWMGRHFFTGGLMPSDSLLTHFQEDLELERQWRHSGRHYRQTADAWLERLDNRRERVMPVLAEVYGQDEARRWFGRWRMFFMACSELFGYNDGNEWWVSHYLFRNRGPQ